MVENYDGFHNWGRGVFRNMALFPKGRDFILLQPITEVNLKKSLMTYDHSFSFLPLSLSSSFSSKIIWYPELS